MKTDRRSHLHRHEQHGGTASKKKGRAGSADYADREAEAVAQIQAALQVRLQIHAAARIITNR